MPIKICFLEDSVEFDGYSPTSRPLDPPQKAVAYLAGALAQRGHSVTVVNRAYMPLTCDGVSWPGWSGDRPAEVDLLVAVGDAGLFDLVPTARRRLLWVPNDPAEISLPSRAAAMARLRPDLVFHTYAQRDRWSNLEGYTSHILGPGLAPSFVEDLECVPAQTPHAIAVCHPLGGLEKLVRLWVDRVRYAVPEGELHVYSATLDKGILGAAVPPHLQAIFDTVRAATSFGVVVKRPLPDPQMADAYRMARAFLHPGLPTETMAGALMEAQAVGLPAVAFASGALTRDRVLDGQTGRIVDGDDAFLAACVEFMTADESRATMSANARAFRRGRTWAVAASEWEERFA